MRYAVRVTGEHVFVAMTPPIDMNERLLTKKLLARLERDDLGTGLALRYKHRVAKFDLGDLAAIADVGWRGPLCFATDAIVLAKDAVSAARGVCEQLLATPDLLAERVVRMLGDTTRSVAALIGDAYGLGDPLVGKTPSRVLVQVLAMVTRLMPRAEAERRGLNVLHVDPEAA